MHHGRLDDRVQLTGKPFEREQLTGKVAATLVGASASVAGAGNVVEPRVRREP